MNTITIYHGYDIRTIDGEDHESLPWLVEGDPRLPDVYYLAYTYEADYGGAATVGELLGEVWRWNNVVTGDRKEQPRKHGKRSMVVGDVIEVEGDRNVRALVLDFGWHVLSDEEFATVLSRVKEGVSR